MANQVFANDMEISCKSAAGKTVACFPDVCFTPPQAPPTPMGVPIPYPNTGMSKDTTNGSRTVKITGKEVMLKDKSYFKTSYGDEAGCAPKKGVITSRNKGKVYFTAWSMNVKFEGLNVVRHMDLTTHNHASQPGNTPPWMYADEMTSGGKDPCAEDRKKQEDNCKGYAPNEACNAAKPSRRKASGEAHALGDQIAADKCLAAMRCTLRPYKPTDKEIAAGNACCPSQTPHHLIEASAVHAMGREGPTLAGVSADYREGKALSICAEGQTQFTGTHGMMHTFQSAGAAGSPTKALQISNNGGQVTAPATTYGAAKDNAVAGIRKTFPESACKDECIKHQLDYYHKRQGMTDSTEIKAVQTGDISPADVSAATAKAAQRTNTVRAASAAGSGGSR